MGLTVLDAGVLIGVLDGTDQHHEAATAALRSARSSGALALPVSVHAEILVRPIRTGREAEVEGFLDQLPATVLDLTRPMSRRAAELRAAHGPRLRLPDALVLATADMADADRILTTDARWPQGAVSDVSPSIDVVR